MMIKSMQTYRLYILCFLAFFASLIQNIYTPIIPRLQDDFHVPLFWINATVGGFIFIVAIMQIILGKSIDARDSKQVLLVGIAIVIISSLLCAITSNFIIFAISRLLQAIGCGIIPLVTLTLLAKLSSNEERASTMANYQIFLSCAPALAPILGSFIGSIWDYYGIFMILLIFSILLFIMILFTDIPNVNKETLKHGNTMKEKYLSDKVYITFIALGFLVFFTYFSILVYLPVLLSDTYGIKESVIGLLFLPITTSVILGSISYKKLSKSQDSLTILHYTMVTFAIFSFLFGLFHTTNLILLSIIIFILGFLVGIVPALLSTLISQRYEHIKGKVLGIFNFVRYIGMTLGAIMIGIVTAPHVYLYFSMIFLCILLLFMYSVTRAFIQSASLK
ncbi:MFS transporter [Staphylococcus agnetis]|nr:MFS transporter [Staphylococcus agnetis]NJH98365.1 MFS transporter [Staphylococcus agnetis]PTH74507.1 MFS transporter [Staphylococcus agnetis]